MENVFFIFLELFSAALMSCLGSQTGPLATEMVEGKELKAHAWEKEIKMGRHK